MQLRVGDRRAVKVPDSGVPLRGGRQPTISKADLGQQRDVAPEGEHLVNLNLFWRADFIALPAVLPARPHPSNSGAGKAASMRESRS